MPLDPYAVLRALLRAEAARNAPKPRATARLTDHDKPSRLPQSERSR
ncbi:hypothetical protein ACFWNK_00665 [Streptomyces sp. NPDC058417]